MKWFRRKKPVSARILEDSISSADKIRFPTYLNEWKIRHLFDQCLPGIVQLVEKRGHETGVEIGPEIDLGFILKLFGIKAAINAGLKRKNIASTEVKREITPLIQFYLLEKFLEKKKLVMDLTKYSGTKDIPINTIVKIKGKFVICWNDAMLSELLDDDDAIAAIKTQKQHEEKIEEEKHFIHLMNEPILAAAIFSCKFVTPHATRGLPYVPGRLSTFFGRTLGYRAGVLFLDPIIIWAEG